MIVTSYRMRGRSVSLSKYTLEFAKEYLENHFSVIPLLSKSKEPSVEKWEPYQRTLPDYQQIEVWFSNSDAGNNIAIVTGKISCIIAFDIDGEEASTHFNRAVEALDDEGLETALKYTLCIKTGRGNTNIVIGFTQEDFASEHPNR